MNGNVLVCFAGAIVAAYVVALAVWPLLISDRHRRCVGTVLAIVGISACPALIPAEHVMARGFCSLWCIDPLLRVLDDSRRLREGTLAR